LPALKRVQKAEADQNLLQVSHYR